MKQLCSHGEYQRISQSQLSALETMVAGLTSSVINLIPNVSLAGNEKPVIM